MLQNTTVSGAKLSTFSSSIRPARIRIHQRKAIIKSLRAYLGKRLSQFNSALNFVWVTASFADHAEEAHVIFQQELNWDLCQKKESKSSKRSFMNTSTTLLIFTAALHPAGSRSCSGLTSLHVSWGRVWISKRVILSHPDRGEGSIILPTKKHT